MDKHVMIPPPKTDLDIINESHISTLYEQCRMLIAENKKLRYIVMMLWLNVDTDLFSSKEQEVIEQIYQESNDGNMENPFNE